MKDGRIPPCHEPQEDFPAAHFYVGGMYMSLIRVDDLTFAYPGSYDNVYDHVSFQFDT